MSYTVTQESFSNLATYYTNPGYNLRWEHIFVLPEWLKVWWQTFNSSAAPNLLAVRDSEQVIGIAPLQIMDGKASFIGSPDVCDYLDFVVAPGKERDFFFVLLDELPKRGIKQLDLAPLRPDSSVHAGLLPLAKERGYKEETCQLEDVSMEMDLPPTWDEYVAKLDGKQRHEVKRKLGKLEKSGGDVHYYTLDDRMTIHNTVDIFLKLFSESRQDKAEFMSSRMESFFRAMVEAMSGTGLLRLGVLELNKQPGAMVMYFDYHDCIYLYNSAYNPDYSSLSVGLISKVLCIQDSIQKGRKKFDFLKGAESYKCYLGGKQVHLYRCQLVLS